MVFAVRYAHEGVVKQAPKAQVSRGSGGILPKKNFIFRASEMLLLMIFRGKFHK